MMGILSNTWSVVVALTSVMLLVGSSAALADDSGGEVDASARFEQHLQAGEFAPAMRMVEQAPAATRDRWLQDLADAQFQAGMSSSALRNAARIQDSQTRTGAFQALANQPLTSGGRGGAALADFDSLIELITSTIAPDTWEDVGGPGAIEEFPTGVLVDAAGLLKKIELEDGDPGLTGARDDAAERGRRDGLRDARHESPLRKISLAQLERRLQVLAASRLRPDEEMQSLAGLHQLKYVFIYPETRDIVLAGPAGDWNADRLGRVVSTSTGRPCLQLDDLLVVLRNALHGDGRFGCAITPTRERLADVQAFLTASASRKLTPTSRDRWLSELRDKLGPQEISVWGIDPRTRTARILVEADYHMKLVGLGLEESVLGVTSYLDSLPTGGEAAPMDVLRWWFTLNYDHVQASPERDAFALRGPAVQVLGENELLTARGERVHTGKADDRNRAFTHSFTAHYAELAEKYPIYADLRNIFDLAMVAEIIRAERLANRTDLDFQFLLGEDTFEPALGIAPQWVETVMNHRIINRTQVVVAVSGGVSVDTRQMLASKPPRHDDQFQLPSPRGSRRPENLPDDAWWWD